LDNYRRRVLGVIIKNPSFLLEEQRVGIFNCPFFSVDYFKIYREKLSKHYYVINFGPRVGVIIERDQCILLTKQYRFLLDAYSLEIPGGKVELNETLEDAVIRECFEETGVVCQKLEKMVMYYPGLDNVENETSVFYCKTYVIDSFTPNDDEVVATEWIHIDDCLELIRKGAILDSLTINAILAYKVFY